MCWSTCSMINHGLILTYEHTNDDTIIYWLRLHMRCVIILECVPFSDSTEDKDKTYFKKNIQEHDKYVWLLSRLLRTALTCLLLLLDFCICVVRISTMHLSVSPNEYLWYGDPRKTEYGTSGQLSPSRGELRQGSGLHRPAAPKGRRCHQLSSHHLSWRTDVRRFPRTRAFSLGGAGPPSCLRLTHLRVCDRSSSPQSLQWVGGMRPLVQRGGKLLCPRPRHQPFECSALPHAQHEVSRRENSRGLWPFRVSTHALRSALQWLSIPLQLVSRCSRPQQHSCLREHHAMCRRTWTRARPEVVRVAVLAAAAVLAAVLVAPEGEVVPACNCLSEHCMWSAVCKLVSRSHCLSPDPNWNNCARWSNGHNTPRWCCKEMTARVCLSHRCSTSRWLCWASRRTLRCRPDGSALPVWQESQLRGHATTFCCFPIRRSELKGSCKIFLVVKGNPTR